MICCGRTPRHEWGVAFVNLGAAIRDEELVDAVDSSCQQHWCSVERGPNFRVITLRDGSQVWRGLHCLPHCNNTYPEAAPLRSSRELK